MSDWRCDTPVAFFVFNRPEKVRRVLRQIAAVEPPELLVVADGPRAGHPRDEERCQEVRSIIDESVDWGCSVEREYADRNLGLRRRFGTGLQWIFNREREAIILEDDCLPNESFFRFCEAMLEEFREDDRVWDITGSNHLGTWKAAQQDYHFSRYGGIWGWATWRRAWEHYDPAMEAWEQAEAQRRLRAAIEHDDQYRYLRWIYQRTYERRIETWDYQWGFARHRNNALSVVPARNLVSNIGFGEGATHTRDDENELANVQRYELGFPLRAPPQVVADDEYDRRFHEMRPISERSRFLRLGQKLLDRFPG